MWVFEPHVAGRFFAEHRVRLIFVGGCIHAVILSASEGSGSRLLASVGSIHGPEGDVGVKPPRPYQIAFGVLVPKEAECTNLPVPVSVSSSHIAYGSIRMELVFMILGQNAATAVGLVIDAHCPVQHVDYGNLREKLLHDGQVLTPRGDVPVRTESASNPQAAPGYAKSADYWPERACVPCR